MPNANKSHQQSNEILTLGLPETYINQVAGLVAAVGSICLKKFINSAVADGVMGKLFSVVEPA
ncbi:hypothetical protein E5361_04965 [Histophilus somni]|uniref:hypothetical protein n=1 Tax=Histophilus somni TaxID=731 RepID=UPI00109C2517|nr:hypothetical protein [Histophilus somni]THA21591.1 hypothetical protein E5361_04965 [Histophilus somni]